MLTQKTSQPFGRETPRVTNRDALAGVGRISRAIAKDTFQTGIGTRKLGCDGIPVVTLQNGVACDAGTAGVPVNALRANGKTIALPGLLGIGSAGGAGAIMVTVDSGLAIVPPHIASLFAGLESDGSSFGLFYSTAGAAFVNGTYGGAVSVVGIAIHPTTPAVMYAACGAAGVLKSIDSGATWTAVNTGLAGQVVNCITIDPTNTVQILIGCGAGPAGLGGVLASSDGGASWAVRSTGMSDPFGVPGYGVNVWCLAWSSDGILFAGGNSGRVYISSDVGASWGAGITGTGWPVRGLAVVQSGSLTLYAAVDGSGSNTGVYASYSSGGSWTRIWASLDSLYLQAYSVAVDPTDPLVIYAGVGSGGYSTCGIYKTTNGGTSWTLVLDLTAVSSTCHINCLLIDPASHLTIYAGESGHGDGVYKSTNGGSTWTQINSGFPTGVFHEKRVSALAIG